MPTRLALGCMPDEELTDRVAVKAHHAKITDKQEKANRKIVTSSHDNNNSRQSVPIIVFKNINQRLKSLSNECGKPHIDNDSHQLNKQNQQYMHTPSHFHPTMFISPFQSSMDQAHTHTQ